MIGKRLKLAIEQKRISQKELAERAGICESTLSKYVNDKTGEFGGLKNLCTVLGVSADWMLGLECRKSEADLDAVRRACADYIHNKATSKETLIKIIKIVMNGERG